MSHDATTKTFDSWAATGRDAEMEAEHGDVVRQVQAQLGQKPGERILDLGCGNGWATRLLAKAAPGANAIGVDASPAMIARAEELHSFTIRARYEVASFEALPVDDGMVDRVFSMEAIYYAADLDKALSEVARVLAPGGRVDLVLDFYKDSPHTECWAEAMKVPRALALGRRVERRARARGADRRHGPARRRLARPRRRGGLRAEPLLRRLRHPGRPSARPAASGSRRTSPASGRRPARGRA